MYVSTMTMGNRALYDFSKFIARKEKDVFISYDAGLSLIGDDNIDVLKHFTKLRQVHFLPMTRGRDFWTLYHVKYIVSPEIPSSILNSMNFSTPIKSNYVDFSFSFQQPDIALELLRHARKGQERFCQHQEDFQCLVDFATQDEIERSRILEITKRSCDEWQPDEARKSKYFLSGEDGDLQAYVTEFIDSAKEQLLIVSNKFSDREVLHAIQRAHSRGVEVFLITRYESNSIREKPEYYYYSGRDGIMQNPAPHSKFIIRDNEEMLFGTGNLSVNALNYSSEMFAKTKDRQAIQTAKEYIAVYLQEHDLPLSRKFSSSSIREPILALDLRKGHQSIPISYTETLKKQWMKNYRGFQSEGLKLLQECELEHLHIVSSGNYLKCLERHQD